MIFCLKHVDFYLPGLRDRGELNYSTVVLIKFEGDSLWALIVFKF